ncbi:MAG: hypothetical protein H8D23_11450 [Candidatus Brocadiales bacterium]|nr:hypothetical protein [Candidatus Brocadiales bacterium]
MAEILEETEQAVQPGEENVEVQAGETKDVVETAATEEAEGNGFSIEDIGGEAVAKTDEEVLGVSEKAQERLNNKVGNAIKERNIAQDEAKKAKARVAELEAERAIPSEKPLVPLERNYIEDEEYQAAMDKYQVDIAAYNSAVSKAGTQKAEIENRVRVNDDRLLVQMDELQKKFPNINVNDTIAAVAEVDGFGQAAQYIHNSEHSARIALYLAMNPEAKASMVALTDTGSINREIGKLEERFTNVRNKSSKAPAPLDTAKGEASTVVKDMDKIEDSDEWYREWKKQRTLKLQSKNN